MPTNVTDPIPPQILEYIFNHVFLPPQLPDQEEGEECTLLGNLTLCQQAYAVANQFQSYLTGDQATQWTAVLKLLANLVETTRVLGKEDSVKKILELEVGGTLAFHIRAQNSGLLLRKNEKSIIFEAFELAPPPEDVMRIEGKLLCSYPGPAIEVPLHISQDRSFVEQLVAFLCQMDIDTIANALPTTMKAASTVVESWSTVDPKYITQLLTAILHGVGQEANVQRTVKRYADDVCWHYGDKYPWRRAPFWLLLRVAVQRTCQSRDVYKCWMLLFHAHLLKVFTEERYPSDLLHVARVKTGSRAYKLKDNSPTPLLETVHQICLVAEEQMQARWLQHQKNHSASSHSHVSFPLAFKNQTELSLSSCCNYFRDTLSVKAHTTSGETFQPRLKSRLRGLDISDLARDGLANAFRDEPYISLYDFELLIEKQLGDWTNNNLATTSASEILEVCFTQYFSWAKVQYKGNPEDQSIMILTLLDIWMALDKITCTQHPLLRDYSPEIPHTILDSLLLRHSMCLDRASAITTYLQCRHASAVSSNPSIYSAKTTSSSFAVCFYENSQTLQDLMASIVQSATADRKAKYTELAEMNQEHQRLQRQIGNTEHMYQQLTGYNGYTYSKHASYCDKCRLEKQAASMRISLHEWPLPEGTLESKATVFELDCPLIILIWRTLTYYVVRDIGMAHISRDVSPKAHFIHEYEGLRVWNSKANSNLNRVTFASETNSFTNSHYHDTAIPSSQERVCVKNGLRFKLYDKSYRTPIEYPFDIDIHQHCTLRLPVKTSPYSHLQYAVSYTTHLHNSTIVRQSDCPIDLNIHEYLAFSNLRCGAVLQWLNILREIRTKTLTFSRSEVHTLMMQAAWEIGPFSATRLWHKELKIECFGLSLVQELLNLLRHVEENWTEANTAQTIIYLTNRLAVSTKSTQVVTACSDLLGEAREVTHRWMREISSKSQSTNGNEETEIESRRRACEMATICSATFDVYISQHDLTLPTLTAKEFAILIECSIVVYNNSPSKLADAPEEFQRLLHRDRRRRHWLQALITAHIDEERRGIDDAIKTVWHKYEPGSPWACLPEPNSRWITSSTGTQAENRSQEIHYNILTGELLIDGKPLGRLPQKMLSHPTYQRLFKEKIFDVIPSSLNGMDYATMLPFSGFEINFAFHQRDKERLIIRTRTDSQVFELIPHDIFSQDFPHFLAEDYAHWMDVDSGIIEFRPLGQPWTCSPDTNWCLTFSLALDEPSTMRRKGLRTPEMLLDIHSSTFQIIAAHLNPLEHAKYLIPVLREEDKTQKLFVDLPRFRLSFFLNSCQKLESCNMQHMIIDDNQSSGTMFGLQNQLVLCHKDIKFSALQRSRLVIIPYGTVKSSLTPDKNHVCVTISPEGDSNRHVDWFKYDIDTDLGLLVGNFSLTSHLFKIYLHAVCSHPLPDPLTGQRGTTYALEELGNARSFSFQQLSKTDIDLLRLIKDISPRSIYYPSSDFRRMQITEWSPHLPALSQHRLFHAAALKVIAHASTLTVFSDLSIELPSWTARSEPVLTGRTARQAVFYPGEALSSARDSSHRSRGLIHGSKGKMEASKISRLVFNWPTGIEGTGSAGDLTILSTFEKWGSVKGVGDRISLAYTQEWLTLSLNDHWMRIYEACRLIHDSSSKFTLMFSFAALAYRDEPDIERNLPILLACATLPTSQLEQPPHHDSYNLSEGYAPRRHRVTSMVEAHVHKLEYSPVALDLHQRVNENYDAFERRRGQYYQEHSHTQVNTAVNKLMAQWPNPSPHLLLTNEWFQSEELMRHVQTYFQHCFNNSKLREFASSVSTTLQRCTVFSMDEYAVPRLIYSSLIPVVPVNIDKLSPFTLNSLLLDRCTQPTIPQRSRAFSDFRDQASQVRGTGKPVETLMLGKLVEQFKRNHPSTLQQRYHRRLEESQQELEGQLVSTVRNESILPISVCITYSWHCQNRLRRIFELICHALEPIYVEEKIIKAVGLWPPISKRLLLQLLSTDGLVNWADTLIALGEAYLEFQHAQRLIWFSLRSDVINFYKELDNTSEFNSNEAKQYPIWLAIQIQGNFRARPLQSQVAREMITPSSGQSTTLQLNMGEGKSHVIVPLVAAALADSQKLVRIVVLKSLAKQMFQSLVERLAGLPNRRIFFLPFSRDVKPTAETIRIIHGLFQECARVKGILVAQPEHILSFKLMVVDQILSVGAGSGNEFSQELQTAQSWITSNSRDVLDESDELLHVRYRLIYTTDQQQQLDGGSDRWTIIQEVFGLVRQHMKMLRIIFPEEVELVEKNTPGSCKPGHFPHFRLLGSSASTALVSLVAENVLDGALDSLTFTNLGSRPLLTDFITSRRISNKDFDEIKTVYGASGLWKGLLLLRGLLAHGILVYVFSTRRWRVDYGLDPKRSRLAVPFKAKDVPSLRSEFGHPDIIVSLTCLTYYYGGLTCSQVKDCFDLIYQLDNPSLEYEIWVKQGGSAIPTEYRQLMGINTKDTDALTKVIPLFQYNKSTVDFYLSRVVFPKEAKEFPTKLGTSGWDLAESKTHFTTGFSGTNDNADLLPMSIVQRDPLNQRKTNAQVLEYILRRENDHYLCMQGSNGQPYSASELLDVLSRRPESEEIRVLLDVGAQMLEMTNQKLVERWLSLTSKDSVQGGIFFDDLDNLMVITRSGLLEPLHSSPLLQQIDLCIVYLDDAHTRGTDIKFPAKFRAMVTLGPKVTKDKLVQGCMRMRGLGHGQTLVFCAPPEVDWQIRKVGNLPLHSHSTVGIADVLCWAMSNTCRDINDCIPHWAQQGLYYNTRRDGYSAFSSGGDIQSLKTTWLETAARTLDEMYGSEKNTTVDMSVIKEKNPALHDRLLQEFGVSSISDESMTEEQEREVSQEIEDEPELERPPEVPPALHRLDPEVTTFVRTGFVCRAPSSGSTIFKPLMETIMSTFQGTTSRILRDTCLLATRDFTTTTLLNKEGSQLTEYLRPVNWLVSYVHTDGTLFLVVMSPFEVNALLGDIRKSKHVQLHVYAPRTSESMLSFDDLDLYCVPSLPLAENQSPKVSLRSDIGIQLNLWAGQLYLSDYATYQRVCLLLGLSSTQGSDGSQVMELDRFVPPSARVGEMAQVCLFDQSPIPVLQKLFELRRKGMSFKATHMGKVLQARLMLARDFE